jgi:hypothetical protein
MAREKGPVVQERDGAAFVEDHPGGEFAGHDLAKPAARLAAGIVSGLHAG